MVAGSSPARRTTFPEPPTILTPRVLLLAVAVAVVLLPWLLWRIPAVRAVAPLAVVQILAGVALGPSLLGRFAPAVEQAVFTPPVLAALGGIATLGVLLYVFAAGMHLDLPAVRGRARQLLGPAIGSFVLPLALGGALGLAIAAARPDAIGPRGTPSTFAAAIAACTACTALPVLAALLREAGWTQTRFGQTGLALAAVNDAALWVLLAIVLALAGGHAGPAAMTVLLALAWLAAMIWLVRPLLARLAAGPRDGLGLLVATASAALLSAAAAELIGIGYIIGAFAAGLAVPPSCRPALLERLEPVAAAVLLPFFFMATGLRATIDPGAPAFLALFAAATATTVVGKVLGVALPARAGGEPWRFALALGALMQSKGLMEVVVLAVLLDAGLITDVVFSAMVAMAVVCTVLAAPLARIALGRAA